VDSERVLKQLQRVPLFARADASLLQLLAVNCQTRRVGPGQTVIHEGEAGHTLFIIVRGRVEILKRTPTGDQQILAERLAGDAFGEMSLLDGGLRSASVRTLEACEFLLLDRTVLLSVMERSPKLAIAIIESLSRRLREADMQRIAHLSVRQRLGNYLVQEALAETGQMPVRGLVLRLRINRSALAERLGSARETISREFQRMQSEGIVQVRAKEIVFVRPERLSS
jgi:CRP-like cAMP-binding protein